MIIKVGVGRREQNKKRTREAIVRAATDLLHHEEPTSVTAEKVAEAAGISRRTFFNYFPSVEAILAFRSRQVLEILHDQLFSRPEDEPLIDSAKAVIDMTFTVETLREATRAWQQVEASPGAHRYTLETNLEAIAELSGRWSAGKLQAAGQDASPLRIAVLTASCMSAYDIARRAWLTRLDGPVDEQARDDFVRETHQALEYLRPAVENTTPSPRPGPPTS
ncbi:transcriptional regulator, TetR family [Austwickia chelonae]|uniref:Putative TetR family transcriptional regulator n=1 Tax=Austwickia chelonae NBRC 105200 TaxID=1184607 RepID=K6VRP9_9MICO|nr:TetR/AcrR family transcriptional regulator [Austwickia chelonae]GAB79439.1 putative TetR family transcriptional regulator [Austwickia chelonae NBRC 105200]SEW36806.1 transcriptional regulator, TetR family [Austwickia chelonae]